MNHLLAMEKINISIRQNFIISILIGSWLFLFTILIKPFQVEPIAISSWLVLATGYSLIAVLGYIAIIPIQNEIYKRQGKWNLMYETILVFIFYLLIIIPSYLYHRSDFSHGIYNFFEFSYHIFIPFILILTPLIIFARISLIRLIPNLEDDVIIKGSNRLDYLKIRSTDLVCVSNANNYVEIYFLNNKKLTKKLIRTSLKKVESDIPCLVRVHRSHLINPYHLLTWKNQNTISLTQIEIPISKNHREGIISL